MSTLDRLAIGAHLLEIAEGTEGLLLPVFARFADVGLEQKLYGTDGFATIVNATKRRLAIATGSPRLLVVAGNRLRHIPVDDEPYGGLVYSHAEADRGAYNRIDAVHPVFLHLIAFGRLQAGVIGFGGHSVLGQSPGDLFDGLARSAVDDSAWFFTLNTAIQIEIIYNQTTINYKIFKSVSHIFCVQLHVAHTFLHVLPQMNKVIRNSLLEHYVVEQVLAKAGRLERGQRSGQA